LGLRLIRKSIDSGSGRVSAVYAERVGTSPTACLFIAHGVKSSMNSSLVDYFHSGLASQGFLTVKFNFPYAEGRWRFARKPDRTEVLAECYRRVVEDTRKSEWKPKSLFLGGISMGAAVGSHVVAEGPDIPEVKGLFFLSYPLHRPKSPDFPGDKHLNKISRPMIFVSGTRDIYAEPKALKSAVSRLGERAQIHWVEGADRKFNKHKGKVIYSKTLREIVQILNNWINSHN
jgi:predicted alpha/beta-hydrolase family hydrolase